MANYANIQNFGNPLDPDWQKNNLVNVTAPNGQVFQVHKDAVPSFQGFLNDLSNTGYDVKSSGGFNYRNIRGTDKLSQHAFGNAIDVNAGANPQGSTTNNLPSNIGDLANKYNLEWGGNWSKPDPMHFEWKGPQNGAEPSTGLLAANSPREGVAGPGQQISSPISNSDKAAAAAQQGQLDKQFMGLMASGLQQMAAGAPKQTWQPGAAAPVHRPQDYANIFGGLLGNS